MNTAKPYETMNRWLPGQSGNPAGGRPRKVLERRKIFSEWLIDFYTSKPARLNRLMKKAVHFAEKGHPRFLELIINLVEGPLKEPAQGDTTYNFNFLSQAEKERITGSIIKIKGMVTATRLAAGETQEQDHGAMEERAAAAGDVAPAAES
jgi:hypothetical protein